MKNQFEFHLSCRKLNLSSIFIFSSREILDFIIFVIGYFLSRFGKLFYSRLFCLNVIYALPYPYLDSLPSFLPLLSLYLLPLPSPSPSILSLTLSLSLLLSLLLSFSLSLTHDMLQFNQRIQHFNQYSYLLKRITTIHRSLFNRFLAAFYQLSYREMKNIKQQCSIQNDEGNVIINKNFSFELLYCVRTEYHFIYLNILQYN